MSIAKQECCHETRIWGEEERRKEGGEGRGEEEGGRGEGGEEEGENEGRREERREWRREVRMREKGKQREDGDSTSRREKRG